MLAQILHAALMMLAAPLLLGGLRLVSARLRGGAGPHLLQPWRDWLRLARKRPVLAEHASVVTRVAPYVGAASAFAAGLLVPSFARGMALAPLSDALVLMGLLAASHMAAAMAALDAGTASGGAAVARGLPRAALLVPAGLLATLCMVLVAGTTSLEGMAAALQEGGAGPRLGLALALLPVLALAALGRGPFAAEELDHEPSGRHLALWEAARAFRLLVWLGLLAALLPPFAAAEPGFAPLGWLLGLAAFLVKVAVLGLALALVEAAMPALPARRVPAVLGAMLLLLGLSAMLLLVSRGVA